VRFLCEHRSGSCSRLLLRFPVVVVLLSLGFVVIVASFFLLRDFVRVFALALDFSRVLLVVCRERCEFLVVLQFVFLCSQAATLVSSVWLPFSRM
jgi:hypothetical protein